MSPTGKHECASYLMVRESYNRPKDWPLYLASCHGETTWKIDGKHYCLMHAPTKDKAKEFEKARQDKLAAKDYNFRSAWFPEDADFNEYNFKNEANFDLAVFNGKADFRNAQFSGGNASFKGAQFRGIDANFVEAQFSGGDADFRRVQFSGGEAYFDGAKFSGGHADFIEAEFSGGEANFYDAQFSGGNAGFLWVQFSGGDAHFNGTQFGGLAYFHGAQFSGGKADFNRAEFIGGDAVFSEAQFIGGDADFSKAQFSKTVHFEKTVFAGSLKFKNAAFENRVFFDDTEFKEDAFAIFTLARFMDFTRFMDLKIEDGAEFYFGEAIFEQPERVYFSSIPCLKAHWFLNSDIRKFNFENVVFPSLGKTHTLRKELAETQNFLDLLAKHTEGNSNKKISRSGLLLVYSRLAVNAEDNSRHQEASSFRYMAKECERTARWNPADLNWWHWISSGYGEKWERAAMILLLIWIIPIFFYTSPFAIFTRVELRRNDAPVAAEPPTIVKTLSLSFTEAAFYSLNVMTFQKPEPKPSQDSTLTSLIVLLQTILGPLQAARVTYAIAKKYRY